MIDNSENSNLKVIFLRGGTGVGKTTIAKLLATKLYPSVHIEQDKIRYMVVNGLVASRAKLPPGEYQDEYEKQCKLANSNTLSLTRNFTEAGFNVIIDGFNGGESGNTFSYLREKSKISWIPKKNFLSNELGPLNIYQIVLDTEENELINRLKTIKGWDETVIEFILFQRSIFLESVMDEEIDLFIDTASMSPEMTVSKILSIIFNS